MRALLVGYGSIGRRHLNNFYDLGIRDWAVVRTGKGTLPLEPPCPVRTYSTLEQALSIEHPDFAVIANPTILHVQSARACIEADVHVLLEKPVASSLEGIDDFVALASSSESRILVAYHFRYHPALARIRELLAEGTIGRVLHARAIWGEYLPSWHPWEDWRQSHASRRELGGGVLHISHPLDYLRMLLGDATQVVATFPRAGLLGLEVPESADLLIEYENGASAQVHLDYWTRPTANRLELSCSEGSLVWDYVSGELHVWDVATERWRAEPFPGVEARNDLFVAEARHFLDVVAGEAEPRCALEDGVAVVRLAVAAERSAQRGAVEKLSGVDAV